MKVFIAALIFLGIAIFIMCFNIIFRKGKEFPDSAIEHNKELRKRGIICAREEEIQMWVKNKKKNKPASCSSCSGCAFDDDCDLSGDPDDDECDNKEN